MSSAPDFTVYSPDHHPQLAVEVKYRHGASDEWAARFRRNLLTHSVLLPDHRFLLVLPDYTYFWHGAAQPEERSADLKFRTEEMLQSLFRASPVRPTNEENLELAVKAWLNAIMRLPRQEVAQRHGWLLQSGIYDRIHGGHVESLSAA